MALMFSYGFKKEIAEIHNRKIHSLLGKGNLALILPSSCRISDALENLDQLVQNLVVDRMSLSSGRPRFYGKLPVDFKLNKEKEHLHRSNRTGKRKSLMVVSWLLGVTLVGISCFWYGFSVGFYKAQFACPLMKTDKDSFLLERFNVSQEQLLALPDKVYEQHVRHWRGIQAPAEEESSLSSVRLYWPALFGILAMVAPWARKLGVKVWNNNEWMRKLLAFSVSLGVIGSIWLFYHMNRDSILRREETLSNMCDERARMLQDQFNVSMNHVHALAILVSTFHHGKNPSAIDQKTFGEYAELTAFERPLTHGVAYAVRVLHAEREEFEKQHGWTIKRMKALDQTLVQDCDPEKMDPAPDDDEYAPVIFTQRTVSHLVSIDMMSGKEDRENILRAKASEKGVLTSPFKLLKSNHLGVVLTFAVYNTVLPVDATPEQRIAATVGYLGASYDVPSQVEKLLQQLASKQTIVVNVYDTTNTSSPITMFGPKPVDTGLLHVSRLDFGDPIRSHEMHCRYKQPPSPPWAAIFASGGALVITLLVGHIFRAAISKIDKVEEGYYKMMELKARAEAADVAKSQFLATVSHEIRTPMNGVLGMLQMLMDTDLDPIQMDYAQTAHASGKDLIYLINEVLDQAKIESGRLELEAVPFNLRAMLDNILSLFTGKSHEKEIELAVYVSSQVPEVVIGDPGRFRQIITNLVGNSVKFTKTRGHIFVSVHLAEEVKGRPDMMDEMLRQTLEVSNLNPDCSERFFNTLSGLPVVDRWESWARFKQWGGKDSTDRMKLLVTVEDTGVGIPHNAQDRIFTPFMQADSSTSRTYGGTGIGLSICKCLVGLMEGEIGFVSQPDVGSTFSFTVALMKGELSSLDDEVSLTEFKGLRALVVDRISIRAEVTRYHLQRLGIYAEVTHSVRSAALYLSSTCNASASSPVSMILIDNDAWVKDRINGLGDLRGVKIFVVATVMSCSDRTQLKSGSITVENIVTKPVRLGVLATCFQEAFCEGGKKRGRPAATLGSLLNGKRILVVDDNMVNRRVAEGALKKYGALVTCVPSGRAALQHLEPPHCFDACFMDLQMPEMDGFEATRRVRRMEAEYKKPGWHTPVLAMTADIIQANQGWMSCGMDGFVSKPFEEEQLYSALACFFQR